MDKFHVKATTNKTEVVKLTPEEADAIKKGVGSVISAQVSIEDAVAKAMSVHGLIVDIANNSEGDDVHKVASQLSDVAESFSGAVVIGGVASFGTHLALNAQKETGIKNVGEELLLAIYLISLALYRGALHDGPNKVD